MKLSYIMGIILTSAVFILPFITHSLFAAIIIFVLLSFITQKKWKPVRPSKAELFSYFFSLILVTSLKQINLHISSVFTINLPPIIQIILAVLIVDTLGFWLHYVSHLNNIMWKIHEVHHSPDSPSVINSAYENFADAFIRLIVPGIILQFLGFRIEIINIISIFSVLIGAFSHLNTAIQLPKFILISINNPITHRIHHHKDKIAVNCGSLFHIWDHIMRTYELFQMRRVDYGLKKKRKKNSFINTIIP